MKIDAIEIPAGFAVVGVRPLGGLEATSAAMARALGGLNFEAADAGMFDEYPAYVAYSQDMRFALLAPPDDEDPQGDYQLLVEPLAEGDFDAGIDITKLLLDRISTQGELDCWEVE